MLPARRAAERLSIAPDYIGKLCREGKLECQREDGSWYVAERSLAAYETSRKAAREERAQELAEQRRAEQEHYRKANGVPPPRKPHAPNPELSAVLKNLVGPNARAASMALGAVLLFAAVALAGARIVPGQLAASPERENLSAALAQIRSPFFLTGVAPVALEMRDESVLAAIAQKVAALLGGGAQPPLAAAPSSYATTTVVNNYNTYPVVERTVVERAATTGILPVEVLTVLLAEMDRSIRADFTRIIGDSIEGSVRTISGGGGGGLSLSDLTDANIPDTITASNYLPLIGGTLTGALNNTSTATSSFTGGIAANSFDASATSTFGGIRITGLDCSVFNNDGKLTTDASGNIICGDDGGGGIGSPGGGNTQVQYNDGGSFGGDAGFTYNDVANRLTVEYASTTGITASYASSTELVAGSFSLGGSTFNSLLGAGLTNSGGTLTVNDAVFLSLANYFASTSPGHITTLPNLSITESQISDLGSYLTTAVTAIGPAGQLQTGPAITLATSSDTNVGLTITGAGNTLTLTSTWSGTLAGTRGGTGLSTVTQNQLLIGAAGNTWTQVATSSLGLPTFADLGGYLALSDYFASTSPEHITSLPNLTVTASQVSDFAAAADARIAAATTTIRGMLSASTPLQYDSGTGIFSILLAGTAQDGYLSSIDWNTFNNKVSSSSLASFVANNRDWQIANGALTPTTTLGILVTASSTIGAGTQAGGLTISGGATTTGNLVVLGTGTSTFAGGLSVAGHLVPSADDTFSLGSASLMWRDVYIGPGSLYVNGKKVIEDDANIITISTDDDQNLRVQTDGSGNVSVRALGSGNANLTTNSGNINITSTSGNVNVGTTGSGLLSLGTVTTGVWHGSDIDISDYTNLAVSYPVTLTGDTLGLAFGTSTSNTWGGTQTFTNILATSASTTNLAITSLANALLTTNASGSVVATSTLSASYGGTGTSTPGAWGDVLTWNGSNWQGFATSSLGIVGDSVALGTDNQIPFINAGGTDFEYASGFTFDGTVFSAPQALVTGSSTLQNFTFINATGTAATTTRLAILGITNALLKTNAQGSVVPAIPGTDYLTTALTQIGPAGQLQTGPAVTLATSSDINVGLTITGAGNTLTFTSTWSGELQDDRVANDLTISGGTVNNTPIGGSGASTAVFTNATTTNLAVLGAASSTAYYGGGLTACADADDKLVWSDGLFACATDAGAGGGITQLGPAGQLQTGPAITIATSTSAFNGLTANLVITGAGNTLTFTSSLSGELEDGGVANNLTISGGTVNNTPIGALTPSTGAFTSLTATNATTTTLAVTSVASTSALVVSGTANTNALTIAGLQSGGTQCLQVNSAGVVSATGVGCGTGSGESQWELFNGVGVRLATSTNRVVIGAGATTSQAQLEVITAGTMAAYFSGSVGIGSSSPAALLSVHARAGETRSLLFAVASSTASATTTHFAVTNTGSVGIGTSSPWAKLSVVGGSISQLASGNPTLASSTPTGGNANDVAVSGRYAYVAAGTSGLRIYEVSNTASPRFAGSYTGISGAQRVVVSGNYAYITDTSAGLVVLDISNPASPSAVGSLATGVSYGVALSGRYLYIASYNDAVVRVVDVGNPAQPRLVANFNASGQPSDVVVAGRYAYVAIPDGTAVIDVVDISNPASPSLVSSYSHASVEFPWALSVSGGYLYIADIGGTAGFSIANISNPTSPSFVGSYVSGSLYAGVDVAGRYAYVSADDGDLTVLDVQNPAAPALVGTYSAGSVTSASGVFAAGRQVYLAAGTGGLHIVDINGAELPAANIGALAANTGNFADSLTVGQDLYAGGGLSVGLSGIASRGDIASRGAGYFGTRLGVGTTSPSARLAIHANTGDAFAQNLFLIASSTANATTTLFSINNVGLATLTNLLVTGSSTLQNFSAQQGTTTALAITGLTNALLSTNANGSVVATTSIGAGYITGLLGTINGTAFNRGDSITITAASSTLLGDTNTFSALTRFNTGLLSLASTTIGNGTQAGGLTISGGATTTGDAYFAGNVNIGTTASTTRLTVYSDVAGVDGVTVTNANSNGQTTFTVNSDTATGYFRAYGSSIGHGLGGNTSFGSNSGLVLFTNGNLASGGSDSIQFRAGGYESSQERMRITSTGNVGIGTTSPYARLSVEGNSALGNSALAGYFIATTTTASILPYASSTAISVSGLATFGTASTSEFYGAGLTECADPADKLVWSNGQFICDTDAGAGGGITQLGPAGQLQTGPAITLATSSDTNVGLTITGAGNTLTLTSTWAGTLAGTRGGTGLSSVTQNQLLIGGAGNTWTQVATSSLGLPTFADLADFATFAYPFPANATSTTLTFSGGLLSLASTTIGNGTQAGGLTISGGATTTGNAYFAGSVGVGTQTPLFQLEVASTSPSLALFDTDNTDYWALSARDNQFRIDQTFNSTINQNSLVLSLDGNTSSYSIGFFALQNNASGVHNVAFGDSALNGVTTGSRNIGIGNVAGYNIDSGSQNVAIGYNTLFASSTASGQLNIQNIIYGVNNTGSGLTVSTGNIGIGTSSPYSRLSVWGGTSGNIFEVVNNASTTALSVSATGFGTTTLSGLTINGSATSTSNVGWNITSGCFAVNGVCVGSGANITFGTDNQIPFTNAGGTDYDYSSSFTFDGTFLSAPIFNANRTSTSTVLTVNGQSLLSASSTNDSYFFGFGSGLSAGGTALSNIGIGTDALRSTVDGGDNTAIGYRALYSNISGWDNVAIGWESLRSNIGDLNVGIGYQTLSLNTTGSQNIAIGAEALRYPNATNTVAIGPQAGHGVVSGSFENATLLGYRAGFNLTTGSNNTLLGYQAGDNITSGANNIILGYDLDNPGGATASNRLTIGNLIFGTGIDGTGSTISSGNIGIGTSSPYSKLSVWGGTTGNILEIVNSASSTRLSVSATGFGTTTLTGLTINGSATSTSNVGWNITSGCYAVNGVCVGSGSSITFGTDNQVPFTNAGGTDYDYSSLFTFDGTSLTSPVFNANAASTTVLTFSGRQLLSASSTYFSTFLGLDAGLANGTGADPGNEEGFYNTGIGYQALTANTTGSNNTALGYSALHNNTTGARNTALGYSALHNNTTGEHNVAVGNALYSNTTGFRNVAVGTFALDSNSIGSDNTALGFGALASNATGWENVAIGGTADGSGFGTLGRVDTGAQNTGLGIRAGQNLTTGSGNIAIGWNALLPSATADRQLSIGNLIFGTLPATTSASTLTLPTTGRIGIATSSPFATLSVHANNGSTNRTLFAIGSSTASATTTLFSISNTGSTTIANGVNIQAGCFAINGTCLDTSGGLTFDYPFPNNATTTTLTFSNGLLSLASTTIGNGTALGGLTVSGNATTTGNAYFGGAILSNSVVINDTNFSWGGLGGGAISIDTNGNLSLSHSNGYSATFDGSVLSAPIFNVLQPSSTTTVLTLNGQPFLMASTSGSSQSTGIGIRALASEQSGGSANTAVGYESLTANTTGDGNTAVGWLSLLANTTGSFNVAVGESALSTNISGSNNTALGDSALTANVVGSENTAVGSATLNTTVGGGNTALGFQAGRSVTTGYGNIFLGAHTVSSPTVITSGAGNIGLGNNLFFLSATANNQLNIGNFLFGTLPATSTNFAGVTANMSQGRLGVGTSSPYANLTVWGGTSGNIFEVVNNASSTALSVSATGFGTTTLSGLTINGSATSTSNVGWNITSGCYAVNGTCVGTGANITFGTDNQVPFTNAGGTDYDYSSLFTFDGTSLTSPVFNASGASTTILTLNGQQLLFSDSDPVSLANVGVGYQALSSVIPDGVDYEGVFNTAVGSRALTANTTGFENTAVGAHTLINNTVGVANTALGAYSLYSNGSGSNNTALGVGALWQNTTGFRNVGIGYQSLMNLSTGSENIALGFESGSNLGTGSANIAIGYNALVPSATADRQLSIGNFLFAQLPATTSASSLAGLDLTGRLGIGTTSPYANLTVWGGASGNILEIVNNASSTRLSVSATGFGTTTLSGLTINGSATSTSNVGWNITSGCFAVNGVCVGTGANITFGTDNQIPFTNAGGTDYDYSALFTFDGSVLSAPQFNSTAATSSILTLNGADLLLASTTNQSVSFGLNAALNLTGAALRNVALGNFALQNATSTADNIAVGFGALTGGASLNTGVKNIAIGSQSLFSNTSGGGNIGIGYQALALNTTGSTSVAVGSSALRNNSTGNSNSALGYFALNANTTGSNNTGVGYQALAVSQTAINNTGVGYAALSAATNGWNTGLGSGALFGNTSGWGNIGIGYLAGQNLTTGDGNIALGTETFFPSATADRQLNIGGLVFGTLPATSTAFQLPTTGALGVATSSPFATLSLHAVNGSTNTTLFAIGSSTASATSTLFAVTNTGRIEAGNPESQSIYLGLGAGTSTVFTASGGLRNVGVGYQALQANTTGDDNVAVGYRALFLNTASFNTALGSFSLSSNTTGSGNTAVGLNSLQSNTTGYSNTSLGDAALTANTTGNANTAVGTISLAANTTGSENTAVGGTTNDFGRYTLGQNTIGSQNTALGIAAGWNLTSGSANIAIGYNALLPSATANRQLSIGNLIFGTLPATTSASSLAGFNHSGGRLGIATTSPYARLTVWGDTTGNIFEAVTSASTTALSVSATGFGTTTLSGLTINGSATSTSNVGWNITSGCYAVNGTCLSTGGPGSLTGTTGQVAYFSGTDTAVGTSTIFISTDSKVGIGTSTPRGLLSLGGTFSTAASTRIGGIDQIFTFNMSGGGTQIGNNLYIYNNPQTNADTLVGSFIRVEDSTALSNTVRGLEVQTNRGTNTQGENTAISGTGRTFGIRAITEGDAGGVAVPAGLFAQTRGTTQGNAIRAYSSTVTTADALVSIIHETSTFSGTGLLMNLAAGSGTFNGNLLDLRVNDVSRFVVASTSYVGIGKANPSYALDVVGFVNVDQFSGYKQAGQTILYASSSRQSIFVGQNAGTSMTSSASYNTLVGYNAGTNITSGAHNLVLGSFSTAANSNITTGSNNISIGYNISMPSATANNQLNIGNILYGTSIDGSALTPSTGRLGVGTSSPYARLSVHANSGEINATLFAIGSSTASATTTLFSISNTGIGYLFGRLGIGTTSPSNKLSVTDTATQVAIAYDATRFATLRVDSVGDLHLAAQGQDAFFNDDNLWVCTGGSCPAGSPAGTGNLVVERRVGIGTSTPGSLLTIEGQNGTDHLVRIATTTNQNIFTIDAGGYVGIGTSSPSQQLTVQDRIFVGANGQSGMGLATSTFYGDIRIVGKLDVGTIDPVYTIDGTKYATYGHSTIGIKEEVVTALRVSEQGEDGKYRTTVRFKELEEGSDLWLFYQITSFGSEWEKLIVSLTPGFEGVVSYQKSPGEDALTVIASQPGEVSMRLVADRFDAAQWPNLRPDQDDPYTNFELQSKK